MTLLTVDSDSKTPKGKRYGYLTGVLYLAPASLSGKNLCPGSSAGCRAACLYSAGRARIFQSINEARLKRSKLFLENREAFMVQLMGEISKLEVSARKKGLKPAVRLGGTSDIDWTTIQIFGKTVFEHFPKVRFYDYSKVARRFWANRFKNYHLTFSLSENNEKSARNLLDSGFNVAVVFHKKPKTFMGKRVIDGDLHDLRFLDKKGVIVGLKAKGKARKDTTNFVK